MKNAQESNFKLEILEHEAWNVTLKKSVNLKRSEPNEVSIRSILKAISS